MKLFKKCKTCSRKKLSLFVKIRTFKLPGSKETATNRDEICGSCYRGLKKVINNMK